METQMECKKIEEENGLNRTMQYGNFWISQEEKEKLFGLNRTMQYGNQFKCPMSFICFKSLNRTMQYGNFFSTLCLTLKLFV